MSVKVKVLYYNNTVIEIILKGHANFSNYGNDIVCSAISSILFTNIMYMREEKLGEFVFEQKEDYCSLYFLKHTDITKHFTKSIIFGLSMIEKQYPRNINITKVKKRK